MDHRVTGIMLSITDTEYNPNGFLANLRFELIHSGELRIRFDVNKNTFSLNQTNRILKVKLYPAEYSVNEVRDHFETIFKELFDNQLVTIDRTG